MSLIRFLFLKMSTAIVCCKGNPIIKAEKLGLTFSNKSFFLIFDFVYWNGWKQRGNFYKTKNSKSIIILSFLRYTYQKSKNSL